MVALSVDQPYDHIVRNNIFTEAIGFAILSDNTPLAFLDGNNYFANGSGACSACALGPTDQQVDPNYIDPATFDYRFRLFSPVNDTSLPTGYDRNDAAPGLFADLGPDTGFWESDY